MSRKTIVVLGGGVGGQVAAASLRARLAPEHRIILVDRTLQQPFAASFPWLMTGDRRPEAITKDLRPLARRGVEVREEEIQAIVTDRQEVKTGAGLLNYDYLIIALGADLNPAAIPGMQEAAHTFYTLEGTVKLRDALPAFPGGRVVVVIAALPFKCPAAPYEAAMLLSDYFRKRGMRDKVDMHVYTPEGLPMPTAGPELGQAVKGMVES
ncbi:MAG: FAD/NAD(P)-binding oxidoreductase, partial [Chloroflexota bacterium]|nr:FAD/NAD(P)-binding oxidoreductase [Chloroflexota bacterium]